MPQTLNDIKSLLAAHGLHPKHRFGQNFLHDQRKMEQIVEAAEIREGDFVLEVGPGTGALSIRLLDSGARLLAVEVDRDLEPILRECLTPYGERAALLIVDVLDGKHSLAAPVREALGNRPFKLVANLPYNVASPLLANLVLDYPAMTGGVVTIQREVADRLTAPPGGKDYGPLGILIGAMCQVRRIATLPPGCFWPQPKIDSAAVAFSRRHVPLTDDPPALAAMLAKLFGKRRKQIGSILGRDFPFPQGMDPASRPEQLTIEQIVSLAAKIKQP